MRQIILVTFLFLEICNAFCQERYYFDIPRKAQAKYEINLNVSKNYNTDTINFKIESLSLLRPKKSWHINSLKLLGIVKDTIYTNDSRGVNLLLFDINGNPIRKIDLSKIDKKFKITGFEIYNDTLYLVDTESLFLLKFSREGNFISKNALAFNFEDFQIKKEGFYFISKHWDDKRKKSIRISVFDFSLNLLEQYFITDTRNKSELRPKFVAKEDNEVLFLLTECNQIYNLEKYRVSLYLQAEGGDFISNYTKANGFLSIHESSFVEGQSYRRGTTYYFPFEKFKNGIRIKEYSALDLSILFFGKTVRYEGSSWCLTNLMTKDRRIENILEMQWEEDHKYIKDDLLELLKQVDENNKFVVSKYKVIENPDI